MKPRTPRTPKERRLSVPRHLEIGARRASAPGASLTCMVLASGPEEWVGVDLASGALVRSPSPESSEIAFGEWPVYSVISFQLADTDEPVDPARPEAVRPVAAPEIAGRVRRHTARRFLKRLIAPEQEGTPILGARGPSLAFVDLDGNSPSVVLVATDQKRIELMTKPDGTIACSLQWGGSTQILPVIDPLALLAGKQAAPRSLTGTGLSTALGFRPGYLLCGLGSVRAGHAPKVLIGILPIKP